MAATTGPRGYDASGSSTAHTFEAPSREPSEDTRSAGYSTRRHQLSVTQSAAVKVTAQRLMMRPLTHTGPSTWAAPGQD